jgi:alpha-tubulin suppressor-like RCC1 family protein
MLVFGTAVSGQAHGVDQTEPSPFGSPIRSTDTFGQDSGMRSGTGPAQALEQLQDSPPVYLPVVRRDGLVHGDGRFRARSVAAGVVQTCAVDPDGAVWCWGSNVRGLLGVGSDDFMLSSALPRRVTGFGEAVSTVAAGPFGTCVATASGIAWCWGEDTCGQLGRGHQDDYCGDDPPSPAPVPVRGLHAGVIAVTVGFQHACALVRPGAVWCWGRADQDYRVQHTPAPVSGLERGVVALTAGLNHTCALLTVGAVQCWGWFSGGLPNGGFESATPVTLPGWESGIRAVAAGATHVCALRTNGIVECWGQNEQGQLGRGTAGWEQPTVPAPVVGLPAAVRAITAGGATTCATLVTGALWCWGFNEAGQLGLGQANDGPHPRPEPVLAPTLPVIDAVTSSAFQYAFGQSRSDEPYVSSSAAHSCAILADGRLQCWGGNEFGQLGDGTVEARYVPGDVRVAGAAPPAVPVIR